MFYTNSPYTSLLLKFYRLFCKVVSFVNYFETCFKAKKYELFFNYSYKDYQCTNKYLIYTSDVNKNMVYF